MGDAKPKLFEKFVCWLDKQTNKFYFPIALLNLPLTVKILGQFVARFYKDFWEVYAFLFLIIGGIQLYR